MKHTKHTSSGFTLIELLVVIAIIGILASVIIASLSSARGRGADSKIKSQLNSMRAQAQLYTGAGFVFGPTTCPNSSTVQNLFQDGSLTNSFHDAKLFTGIDLTKTRCVAELGRPSNGTRWAVAAQLSSGAWCVDSTGVARDTFASGSKYTTDLTQVITSAGPFCQ